MLEIKYEDKILTLTNYKEPLREIQKGAGFGYYGALAVTTDGQYVQCHMCGQLFHNLGPHLYTKHKITARDYREKFQLAYQTSLTSETERQRMKETTLKWLKSMTPAQRKKLLEYQIECAREGRRLRHSAQPKIRLETMNKRGVCPDQLLDKIKEVKEKIGHTPTSKEFVKVLGTQRYKHLIFKVFGSWRDALKSMGEEIARPKNTYTDDELIGYFKRYYEKTGNIPTYTDLKRGILPDYTTYKRRFGNLNYVRELAAIPTI